MIISIYGMYYLPYLKKRLEDDGHKVLINKFHPNIDLCVVEFRDYIYEIYKHMKTIKKNKIKLINSITDIPPWLLEKDFFLNNIKDFLLQFLFNYFQKNQLLLKSVEKFTPNQEYSRIINAFSHYYQKYFNQYRGNKIFFQINYRKFLKHSDTILSLSKNTQKTVKKFLKLDTTVCYPCVNSDYLLNLPKVKIKYDAINISRIVWYKRHSLFVKAANDLGFNIIVLGRHGNDSIKLDCPHFYYNDHEKTMEILNQSSFYVAPSIFEGFGMTSVEAAFLNKPIVASDIYIHREVLGDYPLYFKRDDLNDLKSKMKMTINLKNKPDNSEIIKRYSIDALKKRLMKIIESLY